MNKAKAILFDLDGTLIDSESFHFDCWNELLSDFEISLNFDNYLKEFAGVSLPINAKKLVDLFDLNITIPALIEKRERVALKRFETDKIKLMANALETVQFFFNKGIPLGLVTSGSRPEVNIILEKSSLKMFFKSVITRDDVTNSKPDPEPYEMAVDSLGYLKDEYIVFEDTLSGIKSAKAAGLTCFAIQSYYPETNKLKKNANRVFENLCEAKMYIIANDIFNI